MGAYALSEPNSGSDALAATCRADLKNGSYRLSGTKMWVSNAKWADLFLVMAKVDGERFSAFLVERGFPGVSVAREEHKMGLKGSSTARLVLEGAEVPAENLLHVEGKGHQVAFNALNMGRFKLSSMSLGPARRAIELSAAYAQERKQFGQPTSNFELIRAKFALMAGLFYVAESMTYRTGALIDEAFALSDGSPAGNAKAAEEFSVECSMCKVFATEAESTMVDEALQVYGGYGFTEEFPIARIYRDARVSRIYEGTNEINRLFIADRFLKRIKEGRASAFVADESYHSGVGAGGAKGAPSGQVQTAALSDLLLLAYAEQSARLRCSSGLSTASSLYDSIIPYLNSQAARAYQVLTGKAITLPAASKFDLFGISDLVYAKRSPLLG